MDFRITHLNAEAREIPESVKQRIRVPVDALVGQPLDVIETGPPHGRDRAADPAGLPCAARITLGAETLGLRISAILTMTAPMPDR